MDSTFRVACIGSRDLNPQQLETCQILGKWIVEQGGIVRSGNADGADQAFAWGANSVDPTKVELCLPWPSFNREKILPGNVVETLPDEDTPEFEHFEELALSCHPAWSKLSQGPRKLHMRNGLILFPDGAGDWYPQIAPVDLVIAWPSAKIGGGGTGQGMRLARRFNIELVDVSKFQRPDFHNLCMRIRDLGKA